MTKTPNTRTDIHRPAVLVTEDYEYVLAADNETGWVRSDWHLEISRHLGETDRLDRGTHQCHHCGAHIRYFAILHHVPTGDYIAVGETCLDNRFDLATAEFHRLRKAAELDRQRQRILGLIADFVEANPDLAWMARDGEIPEASQGNGFVADVTRKFRQYGELSVRQIEAIRKAVERDAERAAKKAQPEFPAGPVPTGRQEIEGVVVGKKIVESIYGLTTKVMVKLDSGAKVYMTEPAAIATERGDRIRAAVTIEASSGDETMGFGKRPARARNLSEEARREMEDEG